MAVIPLIEHGFMYPRNKTVAPYPYTSAALVNIAGLSVGGGPIIGDPPPDLPHPPDMGIWPDPPEGMAPHPEHPIVIPDPGLPPINPPTTPEPPHEGWNWSAAHSGWYHLWVPGPAEPGPKK